jgi:peptidylprolyl isomerase
MAQAKQGDTVKVHYTGRLDDGKVFDSSASREPLQFTIGTGQVISGFEEGVVGMAPGDSKTVNIPADQAYGSHREDMTVQVPRKQLPEDMTPEVGDQLQMRSQTGQPVLVTITNIDEEAIELDANHPLAGEDLTFDIELVEIA